MQSRDTKTPGKTNVLINSGLRKRPLSVVILAAGQGTRMKSSIPKVLYKLSNQTLLQHIFDAVLPLNPDKICVVVKHNKDEVEAEVKRICANAVIAVQSDTPGSGQALIDGLDTLDKLASQDEAASQVKPVGQNESASHERPASKESASKEIAQKKKSYKEGDVLVIAGDNPLIKTDSLLNLLELKDKTSAPAAIISVNEENPTGYGRVLRNAAGNFEKIVEELDATPKQREIKEINVSVYAFDVKTVQKALKEVGTNNKKGEVYITDVAEIIAHAPFGGIANTTSNSTPHPAPQTSPASGAQSSPKVAILQDSDTVSFEGINDKWQAAKLQKEFHLRIAQKHCLAGVTIVDPYNTYIDKTVKIAPDAVILPGCFLVGETEIESGAVIGPNSTLEDVVVRKNATVKSSFVYGAKVGEGANVGPFSYIRPDSVLGEGSKVGAFVETKNLKLGAKSKVPHLSYSGDAEIGKNTNIGCGTIFANYDGVNKHKTSVGSNGRIGSGTILVAPVELGDNVYTGAGAVIKKDVPNESLAVSENTQRNIEGWYNKNRAQE